jgi:pantoate--beta-alanine ligase
MILFKRASEINKYLRIKAKSGTKIGFVPTMGALHDGHISLMKDCNDHSNLSVASIFVNPTQFNDPSDFAKYPVTLEADILKLEQAGCDLLFLPDFEEMYPYGIAPINTFDLGYLETILEGRYRPGHFQGVCQVINRLLEIIIPTTLYLGQKDYQQCKVIQQLIGMLKSNVDVKVVPTVRETSGLAMSSRNLRLSDSDKEKAAIVYHTLQYLKSQIVPGDFTKLIQNASVSLVENGMNEIDYLSIADAETLELKTKWNGHESIVCLIAVHFKGVRLIDNLILHP